MEPYKVLYLEKLVTYTLNPTEVIKVNMVANEEPAEINLKYFFLDGPK